MSDVFKTLNEINVNHRTEQKKTGKVNLTYLSWAWAWAEVCKKFPDANYEMTHYDGKPYLFDEHLGYLVATEVTIQGETKKMSLPVMDGANKAMRHIPYTYKTKFGDKSVEAATMFDINKAMMRCLVKNLAMFGLGLYIYAGEDLPDVEPEKLDSEGVQKLQDFIESYSYTAEQICQSYNVSSLADFDASMAKPVCEQVKAWAQQAQQQEGK
ncbi:single-strand annealing protein [Vibrio phage 1.122.B._10N.286.46.F8]|nr:single-strand annealing protein [Vibrio phage 1.122.A._10N.286.46.F8]AUR89391.1 single-strand annealing protein [Vibrio phage 1.122.B._10N.286.46.F8]